MRWIVGSSPELGQTKDDKIGIGCFSVKHATLGERTKTGLFGIRIMCPSGATYLSADCFSVSYHYKKNQTKRVGLVQCGHHFIEN